MIDRTSSGALASSSIEQIDFALRGLLNRQPQRAGSPFANERGAADGDGLCLPRGQPRLGHRGAAEDIGAADVQPKSDNRQPCPGQRQVIARALRLARSFLELHRHQRGRRRRVGGGQPRPDRRGRRDATAVPVVPGDTHVAIRAWRKRHARLLQLLIGQVEHRPLADHHRPMLAISAGLDERALQKRPRQALESHGIDRLW